MRSRYTLVYEKHRILAPDRELPVAEQKKQAALAEGSLRKRDLGGREGGRRGKKELRKCQSVKDSREKESGRDGQNLDDDAQREQRLRKRGDGVGIDDDVHGHDVVSIGDKCTISGAEDVLQDSRGTVQAPLREDSPPWSPPLFTRQIHFSGRAFFLFFFSMFLFQ